MWKGINTDSRFVWKARTQGKTGEVRKRNCVSEIKKIKRLESDVKGSVPRDDVFASNHPVCEVLVGIKATLNLTKNQ